MPDIIIMTWPILLYASVALFGLFLCISVERFVLNPIFQLFFDFCSHIVLENLCVMNKDACFLSEKSCRPKLQESY